MNNGSSQPFDEQAALERGKRLQEQIHEARRRRQRAIEEFDAFLRENGRAIREASTPKPQAAVQKPPLVRHPAPALPPPVPPSATFAPEPGLFRETQAALDGTPAPPTSEPAPPVPNVLPAASPEPAAWPPATAVGAQPRLRGGPPDATRLARRGAAVAAPVILLIAAVMLYRSWAPDPQPAPAPDSAAAPATAPPRATAPAAESGSRPASPTPAAQPAAPRPAPGLELTTSRPAWVRVTLDDRVVVERELAAGQHLRFDFTRTITVRAGDAGAVRLTAAGRDLGVMGPAGQIRTRTITAPAPEQ